MEPRKSKFSNSGQMQVNLDKNSFVDAIMRQSHAMDEYLKDALIFSDSEDPQGRTWTNSMFTELQHIMRDQGQSPHLKIRTIKFVIYLLLLSDIEVCQNIEKKIYPFVRNVAQYDRHLRLDRRGEEIFKNNPVFVNGSPKQREELKRLGQQYVRMCLESVPVWASWLPTDLKNQSIPSQFAKSYQALKRDGMTFPPDKEFVFYSKAAVEHMEEKVRLVVEAVMKEMKEDSNFTSYITVTQHDSNSIGMASELKKRRSIIRVGKSSVEPNYYGEKSVNLELKSNFKTTPVKSPMQEAFIPITNNLAGNNNQVKELREKERQYMETINDLRRQLDEKSRVQKTLQMNFGKDMKTQVSDAVRNVEASHLAAVRQMEAKQIDTVRQIQTKYIETIKQIEAKNNQMIRQLEQKHLNQISEFRRQISLSQPVPTSNISAEIIQMRRQLSIIASQRDRLIDDNNKLKKTLLTVQQDNTVLLEKVKTLGSRASLDITMNNPKMIKTAVDSNFTSDGQVTQLRTQVKRLKEQNKELRMILLRQCKESFEFMPKEYKRSKTQQQMVRFEDTDTSAELFEPYYSGLTLEEQIRFRKALLKSKELLFKSPIIQVGCVTEVTSFNSIKISLFITNTSGQTVTNLACSVLHNQNVQLARNGDKPPSTLHPDAQQKLSYQFVVKQPQCKSTLIKLEFSVKSQHITKYLLLPISKIKLIQPRPFQPIQSLAQLKQRTVELDSRLISSLPKLRDYYRQLQQQDKTFRLQFDYLNDKYELQLVQVGKLIKIGIRSEEGDTEDVNGLLAEYAFVFSKDSS